MISGFRTPGLVLLAPFELQNKPEKTMELILPGNQDQGVQS